MKLYLFGATSLMTFFVFVVTIMAKPQTSAHQDCAEVCWENSKFVSECGSKVTCLCNDAGFQNAVYQCVYAQCHTSQYGHALHQALAACPSDHEDVGQIPQLFSHDYLKRRGSSHSYHISGSASASYSATRSGYRSASASALASARPTRSVGHGPVSGSFIRMHTFAGSPAPPTPT